jgi:hypothetical protein
MTVAAIFAFMTASLKALTAVVEKATPEQVQTFLDRHNRRMDRAEEWLERRKFWEQEDDKE